MVLLGGWLAACLLSASSLDCSSCRKFAPIIYGAVFGFVIDPVLLHPEGDWIGSIKGGLVYTLIGCVLFAAVWLESKFSK